jgi:hypothetical protein
MDTKYFVAALQEFINANRAIVAHVANADIEELPFGELNLKQISWCLRRAQELKDADPDNKLLTYDEWQARR